MYFKQGMTKVVDMDDIQLRRLAISAAEIGKDIKRQCSVTLKLYVKV
jgi:hypothetical protein